MSDIAPTILAQGISATNITRAALHPVLLSEADKFAASIMIVPRFLFLFFHRASPRTGVSFAGNSNGAG
jgi:hypothetical protein